MIRGMHPMGYSEIQITIEQIANGWMVILPFQPVMDNGNFEEDMIRRQAKIFKEELHDTDPVLSRIKEEQYALSGNPEPANSMPLKDMKNDRIYMFKELDEALTFLSQKIKNG